MKFDEVLKGLRKGKSYRRAEWDSMYVINNHRKGDILTIHSILSDDWEEVK